MQLLAEYHGAVGPLIRNYEGTLERFTGDGMMVFFNDPLPCPDAPERGDASSPSRCAMRWRRLAPTWKRNAAIGWASASAWRRATPPWARIGFEDRFDYTAIGAVVNLAAALVRRGRGRPGAGERPAGGRGQAVAEIEELGERQLKGMARPVGVTCLRTLKT